MKKIPVKVRGKDEYTHVLVDDDDYEKLSAYSWSFAGAGYICRRKWVGEKKRVFYIHREITKCPVEMEVDHIDGNKLNNQKSNLRVCTHRENQTNMKLAKDSTSGFKGVSRDKNRNKWRAYITTHGRFINLGSFDTKKEAARAYNEKAYELFGEFAKPNVL